MSSLAVELLLAMLAVLVGVGSESVGLSLFAVFSVANLFSLARPRRPGLADDYASLAIAAFVCWAGVSIVIEGLRLCNGEIAVQPTSVVIVILISAVKFALFQRSSQDATTLWLKQHRLDDLIVLCLLLVAYAAGLEAGMVIIIGVLVLREAVELIAEAVQEISAVKKL